MATDTLGIMVTKYENFEHISGIVKAARATGKNIKIFMTDEGVRFTRDQKFLELMKAGGVDVTCCEYSCDCLGIGEKTDGIYYGSQYNNAGMLHDSGRILIF